MKILNKGELKLESIIDFVSTERESKFGSEQSLLKVGEEEASKSAAANVLNATLDLPLRSKLGMEVMKSYGLFSTSTSDSEMKIIIKKKVTTRN